MRARNLKPGFFKNEDLAKLKPLTRLLFQGLWCLADRNGRLEDRPERIKAEVLPYDKADVDSLLSDLARTGFIRRYKANVQAIDIPSFLRHQNPHPKEISFKIDAYYQSSTKLNLITPHGPDESGIRNPSSLNPLSLEPGGSVDNFFDEIWNRYPAKDGRKEALRHFRASVKSVDDWKAINRALDNYLAHLTKETWKKPKNGSTWFNNWPDWTDYKNSSLEPTFFQVVVFSASGKIKEKMKEKSKADADSECSQIVLTLDPGESARVYPVKGERNGSKNL